LKLVEDLGEETFPEPKDATAAGTDTSTSTLSDTASVTSDASSSTSTLVDDDTDTSANSSTSSTQTVDSQDQEPRVGQAAEETDPKKTVTTHERQPMSIPETVHINITPENLKDYVGPPTYQRDRMYTTPPPPGVSTGLGYLGNGSGAVMPVEAMVCIAILTLVRLVRDIDFSFFLSFFFLSSLPEYAR